MSADRAIPATGRTLEQLLLTALHAAPAAGVAQLALVSAHRAPHEATLAIVLTDAEPDVVPRNTAAPGPTSTALVLRYLLVADARDPLDAHRALGRALDAIARTPVLTGAELLPVALGWEAGDRVLLDVEPAPAERVRAVLGDTPYRAAVGCRARVVTA